MSLALVAVAMPIEAVEAVDVGKGERGLWGGRMVRHVVEDGSQCLVVHRSDVSEGRGAGQ